MATVNSVDVNGTSYDIEDTEARNGVSALKTENKTTKDNISDTDQIMIRDTTEKKDKLIDYDKLADAILTKITSKQFTLDQGSKTLVQALNELNSKKTIEIINISKRANVSKAGEFVYSGLEFTVPKGNIFIVQIKAYYQQSKPSQIAVTNSKTECTDNTVIDKAERDPAIVTCVHPINNTDSTYYVWVNYSKAGMNEVSARGISLK